MAKHFLWAGAAVASCLFIGIMLFLALSPPPDPGVQDIRDVPKTEVHSYEWHEDPLTGEQITKKEYDRRVKILEAILCAQGDESYCN